MPGPSTQPDVAGVTLEVDAVALARFSELVALRSEIDAVEIREGGATDHPRLLPGKARPPTIVLRRAFTADLVLSSWHDQVRAGDTTGSRKDGALVFHLTTGEAVARYHLEQAWPSKLEVAPSPTDPGLLIETVTLTCDTLQRVAP